MAKKLREEGSTITQQLLQTVVYRKPASSLERVVQKLKGMDHILRLERRYTKEEIIAMYLNKFDFI
ncbi:MAG: transglycosylase domain-containing protein [Saprospiraceae bacterium]